MIKYLQSLQSKFSFIDKISSIQSSMDWRYLIGAAVLILLSGMINYDTRQSQWEQWQSNPNIFFADGQPLVSTTDAGYFLSLADDYKNDVITDNFDSKRQYPERQLTFKNKISETPLEAPSETLGALDYPLLSVSIAKTADLFFDGDLLTAANTMIAVTAFMTAIAIGVMFWVAGFPAEGAIAGTGFGLSTTYLIRTSVGRIDTDQLVIFFVALTITFILLAIRERDFRKMLGFVLLAALSSIAFSWWYPQSLFVILFPVITGIGIFISQLDWRRAGAGFGLFVLATNPLHFVNSVIAFLATFAGKFFPNTSTAATDTGSSLSFPDTFSTITELGRIDILSTLHFMTADVTIGIVGCIGFIIFLIMKPSKGLIFLPFFALGLLSVFAGRRFAFYGAPFVWFGAAWVFMSASRFAADVLNKKSMAKNPKSFAKDGTVLTFSSIAVIFTAMISNLSYVPSPSFSSPVVHTMGQLKSLNERDKGVLATWWDYGYLAHFKSGMATLHDGGIQGTPRTHLIARGFISRNPGEMIQIIKFVGTEGNHGIEKNSRNLSELNTAISKAGMPDRTPYIMVTDQMGGWFRTMAKLGLFNTETGQYPSQQVLNGFGYFNFACQPVEGNKFQCQQGLIDLNHGTLDGKPIIKKSVETLNGKISNFKDYDNNGMYVLLIARSQQGNLRVKLVPRPTWQSAFTQLYELGVYDENRLELVIDNYPAARVYKILR